MQSPANKSTRAAVLWMLCLGPFFFAVYNACNWFTAQRADVGSLVFAWERQIPFMPWLILPYMSIDLFFAASVLLCPNRAALQRHVNRIIAAILISAAGFLLFPLKFTFELPAVTGFNGQLFNLLHGFDKPYNQAPSLHISLLMILWVQYSAHLPKLWRMLTQAWFILIGVSVLAVYQHHAIDVLAGFFVGIFCLYLFPNDGWHRHGFVADAHSKRIGAYYAAGACLAALLAFVVQGWAWCLLLPCVALTIVALAYFGLGPGVFQKSAQGRFSTAAAVLLLPYLLGARLSAWWQLKQQAPYSVISASLAIGGYQAATRQQWHGVIDMAAELSISTQHKVGYLNLGYVNLQVLDLTVPPKSIIQKALEVLNQQQAGANYVYCALGLSRSATVAAAWLVQQGLAENAHAAFMQLKQLRPNTAWRKAHELAVDRLVRSRK